MRPASKRWKITARIWSASPACRWRLCWCDTLDDEPVEDVANRLYREWGIGKKGKDEGILLLLAVKDRKSRAEMGYGIEPIISDGAAGGILRQIRPILQQGNYGGALLAAAQQMGTVIAQSKGVELGGPEPARVAVRQRRADRDSLSADPPGLVLFVMAARPRRQGRQWYRFPNRNDSR